MLTAPVGNAGLENRPDVERRPGSYDRRDALRRVLHELEGEILDRVRSLRMIQQVSEPVQDREEALSESVERDLEVALAERAYGTLRRIDEARARLEEGTYGLCGRCGHAIPEERLQALPFAALCRVCQARDEDKAPPPRARL